jgi:uncharacterized protein (DUF1778 family)
VTKAEVLVLRISTKDKAAIKEAAERSAKSLTTFITEAAVRQAAQVERRPPSTKGVHGGVPTFFRACCFEAAQGGANGYKIAAWHLSNSLGSQQPYDLDDEEWERVLEALKQAITDDDDVAIWNWFKRHYPRCMALVPARRREQFVAGVRRAEEDGRIEP